MIRTPDHKEHFVYNDTDFYRLIREYMGDNAAEWYRDRIMHVDEMVREIEGMVPMEDLQKRLPVSGMMVTDYTKLESLGERTLANIAAVALEIAGWDEA